MGQRIKYEEAKKLFDNWTGKNGPGKAVGNAGFKDTYETWFSVQELKDYLKYIEDNIPKDQKPGVRIYFGNYGNAPGPKKSFSTVFLAPTKEETVAESKMNSNDYELDAYNSGGTKWPPKEY